MAFFIPTCYNSEQHLDSVDCCIKISMSIYGFSIFDISKQNISSQCITCDHKKHQHDDKETLVDGHDNSLNQHCKR